MPSIKMFKLRLRQIGRLLSLSWSLTLAYRAEFLLWLIAMTATPLLSLAIWYAAAKSSAQIVQQEILTYYILIIFVRTVTNSWRGYELIQQILNGNIVSYLIRPRFIYWEFVTDFLATKALYLAPLLILSVILVLTAPQVLSPQIFSINHLLLFSVSLVFATIISFVFDLCLGLTAFWLEDAQELMAYRFLLTQVASGVLIPFVLMPSWLRAGLSWLPFRYTVSTPVEILMGQAEGVTALYFLGIQAIWVIVFIVLLRTMYVRGLKHYAIPGQ